MGDTIGIRVNNGARASSAFSAGIPTGNNPSLRIGTRGNSTDYWSGLIDEVCIWDRLLTTAERTLVYNLGVAGKRIY